MIDLWLGALVTIGLLAYLGYSLLNAEQL
ncbi:K(+)-transporting ATPase subunit F [Desulfitobacterium sp.]